MTIADPAAARAHARAQADRQAGAMPILPASDAPAPQGVPASAMLWAETIAPFGYSAKRLDRGARIALTDIEGEACASLLAFNAEMASERLNVADTAKVQWNGYLRQGALLLSDMGRVLASIEHDDAQTHDLFCGASNQASNARRYGDGANHSATPNARDRFKLGAAKFGLGARDIHPCVNFFKGVAIAADGATQPVIGPFAPGRRVVLRAEMHLILVIANCPHILDPRPEPVCGALGVVAWRGTPTLPDDPIRTATPEGVRAFLNVEDYYAR